MSDSGDELMQRIARAGARLDPGLSDRDVERLVAGGLRRARRRTTRRLAVGGAVAAIAIAALTLRGARPGSTAAVAPPPPSRSPAAGHVPGERPSLIPPLIFADGSRAEPLDPDSTVTVVEESPQRIAIDLPRGRVRFDVVPSRQRRFVIRAGDVTVTVLGTLFTVERVADRVGVAVERGRVRVDWSVGVREIAAGDSGWFPPLVVETTPPGHPQPRRARGGAGAPGGEATPAETAEDLLAAADAARLAGRPEEGARLLRRLLRSHPQDPRAPLAAFTLGRILLRELGRPREAAAAFADVRTLAPAGVFAEDALAREVEAWNAAGAGVEAHARAQEYLRKYPRGRRIENVKALGGIE